MTKHGFEVYEDDIIKRYMLEGELLRDIDNPDWGFLVFNNWCELINCTFSKTEFVLPNDNVGLHIAYCRFDDKSAKSIEMVFYSRLESIEMVF